MSATSSTAWKRANKERLNTERREKRKAWAAAGLCRGCGKQKEVHFNTCLRCRDQSLAAVAKNHEHYKAKKRAAYWKDPEKSRAERRAWGAANKDLKAAMDKAYREKNIEHCTQRRAAYYAAHKETVASTYKERRDQRIATGLCTECGARRDTWRRLCSGCAAIKKEQGKRWRATAPKEHIARIMRKANIKKLYGITLEEWEALFESQGKLCVLCGTDKPGAKGWQTDHDHETDRVRGILCGPCNLGLGCFKDNTALLQSAVWYLGRYRLRAA